MNEEKFVETGEKQTIANQEPEGYEEEPLGMEEYPIDSLLIRYESRTVYEVCRRIDKDQYILDPEFQRDFIWPSEKQSRLIESILMRIPLPVFYLAERNDGKIIVVDGLQRLTTIHRFIKNRFPLTLLDAPNRKLAKCRFNDLPPKLQTRIEDTNLILYLIDDKVPERAKLDIFERVNGGVPLTRQQMRNCLFIGPATRMLKEVAKNNDFLLATGRGLNWRTMRDREFINRFFGFYLLGVENYKGYMDTFLAEALSKLNKMSYEQIESLKELFLLSMRNNKTVFGKHAFRKHTSKSQKRSVINAALFDVLSIFMSRISEENALKNKKAIRASFYALMKNKDFVASVSYSTNLVKRVKTRFEIANEEYGEFHDYSPTISQKF